MKVALRILLLVLVLFQVACGTVKQYRIEIEQTIDALNRGINVLAQESSDWRTVIEGILADLPDELQSTVRIELTELLVRTIAASGTEFRCDMDFLRIRLREDLERIRNDLLGLDTQEPKNPVLCAAVPTAVDLNAEEFRRNRIDYYGFNLDGTSISAAIVNRFGSRRNVSQHLHIITNYQMTLNLATAAVALGEDDRAIVLSWNGEEQSSIPVNPSAPRECETKVLTVPGGIHDFTPRHIKGDADFKGHGPKVEARVRLSLDDPRQRLTAKIYMLAREWKDGQVKSDFTMAEGYSDRILLFDSSLETEPDWLIKGYNISDSSAVNYVDTDHQDDIYNETGSQPVLQWRFVGDTHGDEAGTETKVKVTFRQFKITIEKCP